MLDKKQRLVVFPTLIAVAAALLVMVAMSMSTTTVPAAGGAYSEGMGGKPRFINPLLAVPDSVDQDISSLVYAGLTRTQEGSRVVADLAERWSISADGRTYTFYLRPGLKWQDGSPITAEDVVYTVSVLQSPDYQGPKELAELWKNVVTDAPEPQTVRFRLPERYAPFLEYTTLGILPAHLWRSVPVAKHPESDRNALAVGAGPFKVKEANSTHILLEASSFHHGPKPLLQSIEFRFYGNDSLALEALRKGEVQGVRRVAPEDLASVKNDQRLSLYSAPEVSRSVLLLLNNRSPVLADKNVRRALALGTNRQQLIDETVQSQGIPAVGPVPSSSWAYRPDNDVYNPAGAKQLLEQAGWKDLDAEGVRVKDGHRLQLVILTNDRPDRIALAQAVARQWKEIGVRLEVHSVGWSGFIQDFLVPRSFHTALTEYWSPNVDPDTYQFWHSSQIEKGLNFSLWTNRRVDEVLESARQSIDQAERADLYREFQAIFADENPSIMLYYPVYNFAIDKRVQGVKVGPIIAPADRFENIFDWYSQTKQTFTR